MAPHMTRIDSSEYDVLFLRVVTYKADSNNEDSRKHVPTVLQRGRRLQNVGERGPETDSIGLVRQRRVGALETRPSATNLSIQL